MTTELSLTIDDLQSVSALLRLPDRPRAMYVFAHGAGAGMRHAFMSAFAEGLAERGVASLRYQFPAMEKGSGRSDRSPVAQAAVRAAVLRAAESRLPLFAGGKSFGGRMTSQAQSIAALPDVRGLVFVGFPLHAEGKPSIERAAHLADVACPMLFLQGRRDGLAEMALLEAVVASPGARATLFAIDDADHAFHVRRSSGTDDASVLNAMLDATVAWMDRVIATSSGA